MAKQSHGISVTRNTDTMQVTFDLMNKATEKAEQTLTLDAADIHANCKDFVLLYGMTKILQDRESGTEMSLKLDAYNECFEDTLKIGVVARARTSSGPTVRIEVEALAKLKKITVKQAQGLLQKYSKENREIIFASEPVQKEVAKLQKIVDKSDEAESLDDLLPASED